MVSAPGSVLLPGAILASFYKGFTMTTSTRHNSWTIFAWHDGINAVARGIKFLPQSCNMLETDQVPVVTTAQYVKSVTDIYPTLAFHVAESNVRHAVMDECDQYDALNPTPK